MSWFQNLTLTLSEHYSTLQVCEASFKEAGFDYIVTEKMVCAGGEKGKEQIRQKYTFKHRHNTLSQRKLFVQTKEKGGQFCHGNVTKLSKSFDENIFKLSPRTWYVVT